MSHQRPKSKSFNSLTSSQHHELLDGCIEQLEARLMLAGSVKVSVSGSGNITLKGDGADNYVRVWTSDTNMDGVVDRMVVEGQASPDGSATTIKVGRESVGSQHIIPLDSTSGKLQLKMGGGSDFVRLNSLEWDGDVNYSPGGGGDSLLISNSELNGNVNLKTGGGNDASFIRNTEMSGDLIAKTGGGTDWIALIGSTIEGSKVDFNTGGGADLISFETTTVSPDVSIKTGGFPDEIYLADGTVFNGAFTANLGSFADALKVENGVTFNDLGNSEIDASRRGPNFENALFTEQGVDLATLPNVDSFVSQFVAAPGTTVTEEFEARLLNPASGEGLQIAYLDSLRTGLFRRGFDFAEMAIETDTLTEAYMESLEEIIQQGFDSDNSLESRLYTSLFAEDYA